MKKIGFRKYGRVMVFIDFANVFFWQKTLGWNIDMVKLYKFLERSSNLVGANFYYAYTKSPLQKAFFRVLKKTGYRIKTKKLRFIRLEGNIIDKKGDLDVELALDATQSIDKFDTAMLFTGDSDFVPVIRFLHRRKKKVVIVSTKGHIAKELINAADRYENIKKWKKEVFKSKRARR